MIYFCIYHQIMQNVICSRMTQHFIQQEKSVVQIQKTLQLCLDRISVWCNTNHMLINPVKTKSMVITTRQKHQLSDSTLRLSLDGQNIELFLLSQLQHIINIYSRKIFYNAHTKSHIDYASVVWERCGEVHFKKIELPTSKGWQINPS